VADAETAIAEAQAHYDRNDEAGVPAHLRAEHDAFAADLAAAPTELTDRKAAAAAIPARAPVSHARPVSRRLNDERKRIRDAVRMPTYNAQSALARLLIAHYPRADDEAPTLLREMFTAPADAHIAGGQLDVRIHPLSAPRPTRALAPLCADLTATETVYPGTDLTLVYTFKDH
jgi:hypothetical protein